jgi:hypothetical protein
MLYNDCLIHILYQLPYTDVVNLLTVNKTIISYCHPFFWKTKLEQEGFQKEIYETFNVNNNCSMLGAYINIHREKNLNDALELTSHVQKLREQVDFGGAFYYAKEGLKILCPSSYKWKFLFEISVCAYYIRKLEEGAKACEELLDRDDIPDDIRKRTESNCAYYL